MLSRKGEFDAVGLELRRFRDWRLSLGLAGVLQFFVYITMGAVSIVPRIQIVAETSITLVLVSLVLLATLRFSDPPPGIYHLYWADSRDAMGALHISYTNTKGMKRTNLSVKRVELRPDQPLMKRMFRWSAPVEGTAASMIVDFSNVTTFSLGLGFRSPEEMRSAYQDLHPQSSI